MKLKLIDKEQIEELTKARYADIEAATKQAVADAKSGAKSESNRNIVQANENIKEFIELKEKAQSMSDEEWEKYIEDSPAVKMEYGVSGNKTEDMNKLDIDIDNWTEIRDRAIANSEKELENTIIAIENSATVKLGATVSKNTSLIAEKVSSSGVESVKNGQVDAQKAIEENTLAFWDSVNEIISGGDTKDIWDEAIQGNKESVDELNVLFAKMGYTANNPYMKALNETLLENVETSKDVEEQNAVTGRSYKELADTLWYIWACADDMGYTLEDVFQIGIKKVKNICKIFVKPGNCRRSASCIDRKGNWIKKFNEFNRW